MYIFMIIIVEGMDFWILIEIASKVKLVVDFDR